MGRIIPAFAQFFDNDGDPLVNGWLRFLESGTNNTPKNTFYDAIYQIPNTNPLQLDAAGRCPSVFGTGDYRVISFTNDPEDEDSPGEQVQLFDPVTAEGTVISSGGAAGFALWDVSETYDILDIVTHSSIYYRSLLNSNVGLLPPDNEQAWERINFISWWNSTIFYESGDMVYHADNLYLSEIDINQGNDPTISPEQWRPVAVGYIGFKAKTNDYIVLPVDRDWIVVLDPTATAAATFTLPAGDATIDQFRIAFYNCSAQPLTITAPGATSIWIDSSGEVIIDYGAAFEIVYCYAQNTWLALGNVGPILGGQNIGTATLPTADIYGNNLFVDNITAALINAFQIPDDNAVNFGSSNQASIVYNLSADALDLSVQAGTDINFNINALQNWQMLSTGQLVPGLSNPAPDIGQLALPINQFHVENINIPDAGHIYLGAGQDINIHHTGGISYIEADNSALLIGTNNAHVLEFYVNGAEALELGTDLSATFANNINMSNASPVIFFRSSGDLAIFHNGANSYFDTKTGAMYLRTGATPGNAVRINADHTTQFYNHTYILDNNYHYVGSGQDGLIGFTGSTMLVGTQTANNLYFRTVGVNRWILNTGGTLYPYTNLAYDIGGAGNRAKTVYAQQFLGDYHISPGDLFLGVDNSTTAKAVQITDISVVYIGGTWPALPVWKFTVQWYCDGHGPYTYENSIPV